MAYMYHELTGSIINAAIEVHKVLGPVLKDGIKRRILQQELSSQCSSEPQCLCGKRICDEWKFLWQNF